MRLSSNCRLERQCQKMTSDEFDGRVTGVTSDEATTREQAEREKRGSHTRSEHHAMPMLINERRAERSQQHQQHAIKSNGRQGARETVGRGVGYTALRIYVLCVQYGEEKLARQGRLPGAMC